MADDPKKQLLPLLALTVLIGLAYAGLKLFGEPAPEAGTDAAALATGDGTGSTASSRST